MSRVFPVSVAHRQYPCGADYHASPLGFFRPTGRPFAWINQEPTRRGEFRGTLPSCKRERRSTLDHRESLPSGTLLDSSYRIARVVGSGGFGITYEAEDVHLGTAVAIKEYYPFDFGERAGTSVRPKSERHAQTFAWGRSSFLQEARTLARFEHPSIVRVTRAFEANSTAYMVMRFERGQSFEAWLKLLNRLPTQDEFDRIVAPLLEALEMLHGAHFLHRDIAPDNIMVRADVTPVLLDFGAARQAIAEKIKLMTGIVKPGYSPHEQYSSDSRFQGPWSDLYALGGTLYRAVAGRAPEEATLRFDDDRMPRAVDVGKDRYRPSFLAAIDSCLKLRPSERPQSVAALRPMLFAKERGRGFGNIIESLNVSGRAQPRPGSSSLPMALRASHWKWLLLAAALVAAASLYGAYDYPGLRLLGRSVIEPETAEQQAQKLKKLAEAASQRRAAEDAVKLRKEAEESAKREAETRRKQAQEAERQAMLDAEKRRTVQEEERLARKKADALATRKQAETYLEYGRAQAVRGDHARAIADYGEAIRLNPNLSEAYLQRGISNANTGDHSRAIADYDETLRLDVQQPDAFYARGFSHAAGGNNDRAIADFNEALRLNPQLARAYWQRGAAYMAKEDHARAIADYDEAIRLDPQFARVYWSRGIAREFKGEYDRAIADYDEAVRLEPLWPDAYYARGFSYGMKGDLDRAIADYTEAIRLNPKMAGIYWRRGTTYSMRGEYDRAVSDFNEALRLNPKLASAYWQRGVAYANKGDKEQAGADYDEAIRLDAKLARAYWDRGNLYAVKGDHTRAIADFDQAIRLEPTLTGPYYARANSYAKKGDRVKASEDYRKVLQLDPNHSAARIELEKFSRR